MMTYYVISFSSVESDMVQIKFSDKCLVWSMKNLPWFIWQKTTQVDREYFLSNNANE